MAMSTLVMAGCDKGCTTKIPVWRDDNEYAKWLKKETHPCRYKMLTDATPQ